MTTYADIYSALGAIVTSSTGRQWWRKGGIQVVPTTGYATIFLEDVGGDEHEIVELVDVPEGGFNEQPWGSGRIRVKVEFFKDEAQNDARRFQVALKLSKRFLDLWKLCGLSGTIDFVDVSSSFRSDIEARAEVRFYVNANITEPLPLDGTTLEEFESVQLDVTHVKEDKEETEITETVENTEN